jgi:hypothetical protein
MRINEGVAHGTSELIPDEWENTKDVYPPTLDTENR